MGEASAWVILIDPSIGPFEIDQIAKRVQSLQPGVALTHGGSWSAIAIADGRHEDEIDALRALPGVDRVVPVSAPYRLASREVFERDVAVPLGAESSDPTVRADAGGDGQIVVMVSCNAPRLSPGELRGLARGLGKAGASILDGGRIATAEAMEPEAVSVDELRRIRDLAGEASLALAAWVSDARQIELVTPLVDVLQVGGGSMQDFTLLRELGGAGRPVLLRRGSGSIVEEFLLAAEYVLTHGNGRVILCESGIRTFDSTWAPRFEINAIPVIKRATHLPVLADPSHATSHSAFVPAVAKAAIAAGADGLVLEVAQDPDPNGSSIDETAFRTLMEEINPIAAAVGRPTVR